MDAEALPLHSRTWGAAQPVAVVLLHGLYGSSREWHPLAAAWRDRGGYAVALDQRNHGDSPHAPRQRVAEMVGDSLWALGGLLGAGVRAVVLVGHSMGGQVAQGLALAVERMRPAPWEVRGVVLLDSLALGAALPPALRAQHRAWHVALRAAAQHQGEPRAAMLARLRAEMPEGVARYLLANYVADGHAGGLRWRLGLDGIGDYLQAGGAAAGGAKLAAPLWLVRGWGSPYTAGVGQASLGRIARRGGIVTVRGGGNPHYPQHMDRPRVLRLLEVLAEGGDGFADGVAFGQREV